LILEVRGAEGLTGLCIGSTGKGKARTTAGKNKDRSRSLQDDKQKEATTRATTKAEADPSLRSG
jgi:hypothetical protein